MPGPPGAAHDPSIGTGAASSATALSSSPGGGPACANGQAASKLQRLQIRGHDGQEYFAQAVTIAEAVQVAYPSVQIQVVHLSHLDFDDLMQDVYHDAASPIVMGFGVGFTLYIGRFSTVG